MNTNALMHSPLRSRQYVRLSAKMRIYENREPLDGAVGHEIDIGVIVDLEGIHTESMKEETFGRKSGTVRRPPHSGGSLVALRSVLGDTAVHSNW